MSSPGNDRVQAARLLRRWLEQAEIPADSREWQDCSPQVRDWVWTCLRHLGSLDAWIRQLASRPPPDDLRPFLLLGLAQLLLMDGVAPHAAVHETVEAAKHARLPTAQLGFLNALLRRSSREKIELQQWLEKQKPEFRYSHPGILLKRWEHTFGFDQMLRICVWNQQRAVTYARLTLKGRELASETRLPEGCVPHPRAGFFRLPRGLNPTDLPDFDVGAWYIQDPSTALAPALLAVQPGERVLDLCAAPGGKTILLAESLGKGGKGLMACDPNPSRVVRLKENLHRLGFTDIPVNICEPIALQPQHSGAFDAVLLDVPCSNTGVYQRRPDAKWGFHLRFLRELTALQARILDETEPLIAPGGRLVYSTCSIEPEESREQIRTWLERHPDWCLDQEILQLPGEEEQDGAFAARICRKN